MVVADLLSPETFCKILAMPSFSFNVTTTSPDATHTLGQQIGRLLHPGLVIALHGDLGAGKTALTQGIAAGLGVSERVTSPTFTLVNRYTTARGFDLVHIDCYRLGESAAEAVAEAATFGLEELVADDSAVIVIEWAERVAEILPADHLAVTIVQPNAALQERHFTLRASGPVSRAMVKALSASD
jgi:tRNA threonylcarbamoyladenosine biosynthesis protein TsaE